MRRPPYHSRSHEFDSMTSMIDVVFLLLIFFVVTASSQIRELLLPAELSAPGSVATAAPPEPDPLQIDVWLKLRLSDQTGRTIVDMNGTVYEDREHLKEQLRALAELGPENPVILDIAADVPLKDLVDIYDVCQAAGFESVNFAADASSAKKLDAE